MRIGSRRDTVRLGRAIGRVLEPADLVLLSGGLGAGKTFLARSIVRALGVTNQVRVGSPTFSLVHEYASPRGLILHVDLYRLCDGPVPLDVEIGRLGLREQRAQGAVLLVEWGDAAVDSLGGDAALTVRLEPLPAVNQRDATLGGPRAGLVEP
jgi:tRNA threonylcarbamoyladenosine biosynthesis protein TsaE